MTLDIKMTGILIENNLRIYFYSISMDYISVFMSGPHCFDYGSFILSFEIRNSESVNIVLFSQDSFGYSPSAKNVIEILIHMALNL